MTSFFSVFYLAIFLPVMVILYNVCPKKYRPMVLIAGSYFYFYSISGKLLVYLLFSTMSIHHIGLWLTDIQKERDDILKEAVKEEKKAIKADYLKKQRRVLLFGVMLHLGILLIVKYTPFFATNINTLFNAMGLDITLTIPKIMMPIGISFYTLSAISYIFDVYRETIKADKNILRLALFMSFFPHIMEGPICRYSDTAHNLYKGERTNYQCLTLGLQRILFAMVKKMVVADRLNDFIQEVFTNYSQYDGGVILVGAVRYTIQLYMEFSGTMDIVIGTAQIFNVRLPENFKQPFFSRTISDFWSRWHITLGTFFKDYIFYPLTMSKPLKKLTTKARKRLGNHLGPMLAGAIALFCVWLSNGLWHGAGWQYIFFGMYHFALILTGNIVEPYSRKLLSKLHIKKEGLPYGIFSMLRTTCLVIVGELFFRAEGIRAGFAMFKNMVFNFSLVSFGNGQIFTLGMDRHDFLIVAISVAIIFVVSLLKENNINVRGEIAKKPIIIRWLVYYAIIMFIIIFGAYGRGYTPVDPIYANF